MNTPILPHDPKTELKVMLNKPQEFADILASHCQRISKQLIVTAPDATIRGEAGIVFAFEVMVGLQKIPVCTTMPLKAFMELQDLLHLHNRL